MWSNSDVFGVLRHRSLRFLLSASLLSLTGSQISRIGLILFLFHDTHNIAALAGLVAAETLPGAVVAPFCGALIDRVSKWKVMIGSDLSRMVFLSIIIFYPSTTVIFCTMVLHSVAAAIFIPAKSAAVPLIVPPSELTKANSLEQSAANAVMILGPMTGAELFLRIGLKATLFVDICSYALSALLLTQITTRTTAQEKAGLSQFSFREVTTGWRYLVRHQLARHLISLFFVSLLCVGLWLPLVPFFVNGFLGASDRVLGIQFAVFGVGGIVGALYAQKLTGKFGRGYLLFWALLLEATSMLLYSLIPQPLVSIGICFLWGIVVSFILVPYYSIMQETIHEDFLGRVFSIAKQTESIALLLALLLAIYLSTAMSADRVFFLVGAAYFIIIALSAGTTAGRQLMRTR